MPELCRIKRFPVEHCLLNTHQQYKLRIFTTLQNACCLIPKTAIMENPIPSQENGRQMDVVDQIVFKSSEEALDFYEVAKERLLDVNQWAKISNLPSAAFGLCDATGVEVHRHVKVGDHFKINIPGPGNSIGDGFDWVKVEFVKEEQIDGADTLSIRVRPAPNPNSNEDATAHFFTDGATSTFQVKRMGKEVTAEVHGRNEEANTETGHLLDNARNTLIGVPAKLGMSFPQWKGLTSGLVKKVY
jgi:hypothetical protein